MVEFLEILIWPDEVKDSVFDNILGGIFYGIFWTCFVSWGLTKKVFTKDRPVEKSTWIAEATTENYLTTIQPVSD